MVQIRSGAPQFNIMFDSIEDNFFFERTSRELETIDDPEKLRSIAKEILSLYLKHKEVTKKLIFDNAKTN